MTDKVGPSDSPGVEELALPVSLVKLIDLKREELTRTEFIELCIKLSVGDKRQELEKFSGPSIGRMSENLEKRLRQVSDNFDKKISQLSEEMSNKFDYISEVVDKTSERTSSLQRSVDDFDRRTENLLTSFSQKMTDNTEQAKMGIRNLVSSELSASELSIQKRLQLLVENLDKSVEKTLENFDARLQEAYSSFDKKIQLLLERLSTQGVNSGSSLGKSAPKPAFLESSASPGEAIASGSSALPSSKEISSGSAQQRRLGIDSSVQFDAIMSSIKQLSDSIDKRIDRRIDERMSSAPDTRTSEFREVRKQSDQRGKAYNESLPSNADSSSNRVVTTTQPSASKTETFKNGGIMGANLRKLIAPGSRFLRDSSYVGLWVFALATFGVGDLTTTYFALNQGALQVNFVVAFLGNFLNFFIVKVSIILGAFVLSYLTLGDRIIAYLVPIIMAAAGILLTLNNMLRMGWI